MKKIISLLLLLSLIVLGCASCGEKGATPAPSQSAEVTEKDLYENKIYFTIEMENGGVMKGELYPDLAPVTVENFVKLAEDKFYDGLIFHRVIPRFMIQGGGFDSEFNHKEIKPIKGEFNANGFNNELSHERGVISMARTMEPDSASSQFFIMHENTPSLDGQYAAFGKITEGLDVVDEIASVDTTIIPELGMADVPEVPQVIKTIKIEK